MNTGWTNFGDEPSWIKHASAAQNVADMPDSPDHTMHLAVTHQQLALFAASIILYGLMFPELQPVIATTQQRLIEVADAQGFTGPQEV